MLDVIEKQPTSFICNFSDRRERDLKKFQDFLYSECFTVMYSAENKTAKRAYTICTFSTISNCISKLFHVCEVVSFLGV